MKYEESQLWKRVQQKDRDAICMLVEKYKSVTKHFALSLPYYPLEQGDVLTCNYLGLWAAVERFNPQHGCKLAIYARPFIKGIVFRERLKAQERSSYLTRKLVLLQNAYEALTAKYNREPTVSELAAWLHVQQKTVTGWILASEYATVESLDAARQEDGIPLHELLADPNSSTPHAYFEILDFAQDLCSKQLNPTQKKILDLKLTNIYLSQREIANKIHINQGTVSRNSHYITNKANKLLDNNSEDIA